MVPRSWSPERSAAGGFRLIEGDLVLDLAGPLGGRRLLDVGCGDGTYAILAANRGGDGHGNR
jgi:cyclopropane fatty-acyl-phospholipid synthase-like methyltransferase